jgi:EAL domain-containing protein (putative c-di-GMP-specific phosphodiesterase class I)
MRVEDTRYMQILAGLHSALVGSQFRLHYQPIVSLATRTLAGFEALIRWYHPEQGLISPLSFIPVAEETGLIVPIGNWVMNEACRQMAQWSRAYRVDTPLYMSVNLSTKQFVEEDISTQIETAISRSGIQPSQLKLEITESAVLDNQYAAAAMLQRIKKHGVRVSLDDFGTGYSSFSNLHQLPYDTLKIDRSFVSRIGDAGENSEIIHAIIVLAHNLRMDVVAEGVETVGQADRLRNMWCEYAQGYFFAKPMEADAAGELIASCPQW